MLTPEQADQLRIMTATEGWNSVLQEWLKLQGNQRIRYILDPSISRPDPYDKLPDDFIRGEIAMVEKTLAWVRNELEAASHNRRLDEQSGEGRVPLREGSPI